MKYQIITILFYASFLLMAIGFYLMLTMIKRKFAKVLKKAEAISEKTNVISGRMIAMLSLWYYLPAFFVFVIFCIPTIYLNNLFKRFDYCVEVFRANKSVGITKDDEMVQERCKCLNLDEVIYEANK